MVRKLWALVAALALSVSLASQSVAVATVAPLSGLAATVASAKAQAATQTTANDLSPIPASPTDETRVPHYFGPYANYANSPQALADAVIALSGGGGTGAEATATVDPKTGGISAIAVTAPGTGYATAPAVDITSPGVTPTTAAAATATISLGSITSVTVAENGFGFATPQVALVGGNPTPGKEATVQASGGVDDVQLSDGGSGYAIQPIVQFGMPDLPTGTQATGTATMDANGVVTGVTVVDPGSGYTSAPVVTILDGNAAIGTAATAVATINVAKIDVTYGGEGYDSAPAVSITDIGGADRGATATAAVAVKGAVTAITVNTAGAGYITPGIRKFVDTLPGLGAGAANDLGNYIPVAVPDTTTYPGTDYYEIAVVQYRQQFHKDLPPTLLRGYVQLSTGVVPGKKVALTNVNLDPNIAAAPALLPDGTQALGVDNPHYLGPTIVATKDKPVRILFRDLLPTGQGGDLFLPVDTTVMGSGMGPDMTQLDPNGVPIDSAMDTGSVMDAVRNPECSATPKPMGCYTENRATLHLHGGITPWISDGTPHQWITPAGDDATYPKGVSVSNVPDMPDPGPGAQTFFYTNQQSARLMFYHDHAWGITRLNVYAGEAAGYVLTDATEQALIAPGGALDGLGVGTPLIIQDKTFVPSTATLAKTDPTWQTARWGGMGNLWTPHVYMPAQNPGDPSGQSAYGRWMYGPWFWPPNKDVKYQPIANPYFDPTCKLDDSTTWQYQVSPYCEPAQIPGTPNVSVGMEAFNDTPVVNGTAYPTTSVDPKAYRFRILNAANDRFWNLQWYVADPTTGTLSEVALNPAEVAAAQTDPNVVPTPDLSKSPAGPSWVQIGTEGGFLPTPTVVPNQPITWITNPTRFDFGNVDKHALLLAPAERADVIVDFSAYRGKTLILYNDAPAAFPARQANMDYYTGGPDMTSSGGAPTTLAGYGPNTRTIMQIKVSSAAPAVAFDRPNTTSDRMGALMAAFAHHLDANGKPAGVFESGSDPIVVGQAAYNTAYGTNFAASGWCSSPTNPAGKCDGFARIEEGSQPTDTFKFDTLSGNQLAIPFQPKAIHDEMNSATFDEWGRMSANLGLEAPGATPLTQNIVLFPYTNPSTEQLDTTGLPPGIHVTPISSSSDGTQIWKITHNGVDTHPIHFHLFDVQVINRVTWDNIIMPPDPNEIGWKDTVRVSPLEDTIVAVRPIAPAIPFGVPHSIRPLNPMMPLGARGSANGTGYDAGFNNVDVFGNAITPIVNVITDFGWEYVYHCHILSHEEMDMMRPVSVKVNESAPAAPALTFTRGSVDLAWTDGTPVNYLDPTTWTNPANEAGYIVERAELLPDGSGPGAWTQIGTALANATTYKDNPPDPTSTYFYRVTAWNGAGSTVSGEIKVLGLPKAPTALNATVVADPAMPAGSKVQLDWVNNAPEATSVVIERSVGTGAFATLTTLVPDAGTGVMPATYTDTDILPGSYRYRIHAVSVVGNSADAGPVGVTVPQPGSAAIVISGTNPSLVGQAVTFTATVSAVAAAAAPSGTVTFTATDGLGATVWSDTQPLDTLTGNAASTTTALPAGTLAVTAAYSGDSVFTGITSPAISQVVVNRTATTTVVVSSVNPSLIGDPVTFTATVSDAAATGTVQFSIDGAPYGAAQAVAAGSAQVTAAALAAGSHTVVADYSGDGLFQPSTSAALTQVVGIATTTTLTSNRNPANWGRSVTFTAQVVPATGTTIPTGAVQFAVDGVNAGAPVAPSAAGRATYATATLAAGPHNVTAQYLGSTTFAGSTSPVLVETINAATTSTTLTSSRNPSVSGQSVTLTARTVNRVGTGLPTGSTQFVVDGVNFGAPVPLNATGRAQLVTAALAIGAHSVVAIYLGSANQVGSTSATLTQQVTAVATLTTVTSSRNPAAVGAAVTFRIRVRTATAGAGIPVGTVTLYVDGIAVGAPITLNATGRATVSTNTLAIGTHTVSVVYAGSGVFGPSTSGNLNQRIQ